MADKKYIYNFGKSSPVPPLDRNLLGGKGKGLAEMTSMGLPIPPGFTVTTEACVYYRNNNGMLPDGLDAQMKESMRVLESEMGAKFGDVSNPLLVSVRSGARVSMPGMMETILDLGLNDKVVVGFAKRMNSEKVAYDSYRRFLQMYSNVVENIDLKLFEECLTAMRKKEGVDMDISLSSEGFKALCGQFKEIYKQKIGEDFPSDPWTQLTRATKAVFRSWDNPKALSYRAFHGYPDNWGTAVNIVTMVFGNRGEGSATGVGFTRDPSTGIHQFYGEFLPNAQGEDVVAGIRTPQPVNKMQAKLTGTKLQSLEEAMPEVYKELENVAHVLEQHFHDMQDVEFTIDNGRLFMLQTRAGKRTGHAAVKIALDMLDEGLLSEKEAIMHVEPTQLTQLLTPIFDMSEKIKCQASMVARGLNAGPGAACGVAVLSSEDAVKHKAKGVPCVLVRDETSPEDFAGMVAAEGILTVRGGATSHAAVVARGLGKPCVCGCGDLRVDEHKRTISVRDHTVKEGDYISIDGTTGQVFFCKLETKPSEVVQVLINKTKKLDESDLCKRFVKLMKIADKYRRMHIRTNADTAEDTDVARCFGAEGIGLVRTEHMFMAKERLMAVRQMMFSEDEKARMAAVDKLMPYQKSDFTGIFKSMLGRPVTIRLLDPPRHEFLPHQKEEKAETARVLGMPLEKLEALAVQITEQNPMLGHRGCRLGIAYPYLTAMQVEAILEAACDVYEVNGKKPELVMPEIMVPLVGHVREFVHQKLVIDNVAKSVFKKRGYELPYHVGTMIEVPRAALVADDIVKAGAEFFSFGTNDLTQCALGLSRDDAGTFLPLYIEGVAKPGEKEGRMQILDTEPFQVLDTNGVGELMRMACEKGRKVDATLHLGICGEHGGEPRSVKFCHSQLNLDYVSCSPYRVPVARLAAAQAAIEEYNDVQKALESANLNKEDPMSP